MAMVGVLGLLRIGCRRLTDLVPGAALRSPVVFASAALVCGWFATELALHAEALRPAVMVPGAVTGALKAAAVEQAYFWSVWIGVAVSLIALTGVVRSSSWRR